MSTQQRQFSLDGFEGMTLVTTGEVAGPKNTDELATELGDMIISDIMKAFNIEKEIDSGEIDSREKMDEKILEHQEVLVRIMTEVIALSSYPSFIARSILWQILRQSKQHDTIMLLLQAIANNQQLLNEYLIQPSQDHAE